MRRLVFIDDDQSELDAFRNIVEGDYKYETIHWPRQAGKLFRLRPPAIYVSDLYLPTRGREKKATAAERDEAKEAADLAVHRFSRLYAYSWDDKKRMRKTMDAMGDGRLSLDRQWKTLGQSPAHGIALCRKVMEGHPNVPFVFYSRKITPEDVIAVLQAGAADAIRKGALDRTAVLDRLHAAQELYAREDVRRLRRQGFNVNITIIPPR